MNASHLKIARIELTDSDTEIPDEKEEDITLPLSSFQEELIHRLEQLESQLENVLWRTGCSPSFPNQNTVSSKLDRLEKLVSTLSSSVELSSEVWKSNETSSIILPPEITPIQIEPEISPLEKLLSKSNIFLKKEECAEISGLILSLVRNSATADLQKQINDLTNKASCYGKLLLDYKQKNKHEQNLIRKMEKEANKVNNP